MNELIEKYLDFYLKDEKVQYGILLNGEWGIGKTFFINQYLEKFIEKEENVKQIKKTLIININLFGVENIQEVESIINIEKLFFTSPEFLKNNHLRRGYRFLKKYSGTEKLDKIESILTSWQKKEENYRLIYIFDELERTNLDIKNIMGYIHDLFNQENNHIIIIANENEIKDDTKKIYKESKDKIIGKSFEVNIEIDKAFKKFLEKHNCLTKDDVEKIIQSLNNDSFKKINLRKLKQVLIEFCYFQEHTHWGETNINLQQQKEFIYQFFILNLKIKQEEISIEEKAKIEEFDSIEYDSWKNLFHRGFLTSDEWNLNKKY